VLVAVTVGVAVPAGVLVTVAVGGSVGVDVGGYHAGMPVGVTVGVGVFVGVDVMVGVAVTCTAPTVGVPVALAARPVRCVSGWRASSRTATAETRKRIERRGRAGSGSLRNERLAGGSAGQCLS
jgi:hypothetical protein